MVAVIAIFIVLVQIHVVQARAAVEHAIIDDKAFEMQHAQRLAGIHRHAVDRYADVRVFLRHAAIPVGVSVRGFHADASALRAMPVHQDADVKLRALTLGFIKCRQHAFAAIVLLKIERDDADTRGRRRYLFQELFAEIGGRETERDIIN